MIYFVLEDNAYNLSYMNNFFSKTHFIFLAKPETILTPLIIPHILFLLMKYEDRVKEMFFGKSIVM